MRCTECSSPILPIVAVDIDGTLAQYHRHFFDFADGYFNRQFSREYYGLVPMEEHMEIPQHEYQACKLAYRQGGMKRSIPVYPGATTFMQWLRTLPVEVWITTTRAYQRHDGIDPDTRFWLEQHKIEYDHLLYHGDKYKVLANSVDGGRVVAIVDDLDEQCDAAEEFFGPSVVLLMGRMHNMHANWRNRVPSFSTLEYNIEQLLKEWNNDTAEVHA